MQKNISNKGKLMKKITLIMFIIVLPIFILSIFIIQFNNNTKRFYFDKEDDKSIYLSKGVESRKRKFDEYFANIDIKLTRITDVEIENDDKEKINIPGKYDFNVNYELKSYYEDANVSFRWVMMTDYTGEQSTVGSRSNSDDFDFTINYAHNFPNRKYLLFKVKKPVVFVEVKIKKSASTGDLSEIVNETLYYKIDINKIKYHYDIVD